jgi:hypothetical protein
MNDNGIRNIVPILVKKNTINPKISSLPRSVTSVKHKQTADDLSKRKMSLFVSPQHKVKEDKFIMESKNIFEEKKIETANTKIVSMLKNFIIKQKQEDKILNNVNNDDDDNITNITNILNINKKFNLATLSTLNNINNINKNEKVNTPKQINEVDEYEDNYLNSEDHILGRSNYKIDLYLYYLYINI